MTIWQLLTSTWSWEPSIVLGCALLLGDYLAVVRFRRDGRRLLFVAGDLILLLALVSPLDELGDTYLFSAHMAQHLLLVLVVPPLLLLGIPPQLFERLLAWRPAWRVERVLGQPVVAWLLGIGFVWMWHVPALYRAALADEGVHAVEHLCFLVTSTIFWWPLLAPPAERRLSPPTALIYLMAAGIANTLLGVILAFSPLGLYAAYVHPFDVLGIVPLLRDQWGLTPQADQKLGGLLMWIPGGLVYVTATIAVVARWYGEEEREMAEPVAEVVV